MFKVMCINDGSFGSYGDADAPILIEVGQTYDVVDTFNEDGFWWYELTIQPDIGYPPEFFIRTSNIDEKELLEERELQLRNA